MDRKLGIYVHIPFCASKCSYCDFYSLTDSDYLMPEYQSALLKHIAESTDALLNYEVDSIYFGGGTPSFFGAKRICELFEQFKLVGNVRTDAEVTVEVNPDSVTPDTLKMLRRSGVNRLSIGMQASDNNLLKLIGRRHNFQQVVRAVNEGRKAGFANISLDLIYGLPTQTKNDWADALGKAIELHPEHISCYGLKLEEGTPMYENYKGSPVLPDDDEQADMYCYAAEQLDRYGFKQYEISNFAAKGFESRHNLKYWNLEDYIGFGPGAHSCIGSLRYSYIKDIKGYIAGINRGSSIIEEYETLTPFERAVEYIMLAMRTTNGMSAYDYGRNCRCDWRPIEHVLMAFREKGWTELTGDRWHFTVPGFLISNTLIGILIETQASSRVEGTPWLSDALDAEEKTSIPLSEEELFREVYEKKLEESAAEADDQE